VNRNQQRHGSHKPIQEFETTSSMGYNGVDYFAPEMTIALPPISSAGGGAHQPDVRGSWQASCGQDVVVVANFAEQPKQG